MTRLLLVALGDIAPADLHRLVDAGGLRAAGKLLDTGISAAIDVDAQDPIVVWASMMTGVPSSRHGIRDPFAARADGGGIGPVGAGDWRSKPVWQILADEGIASVAVSCPGSTPATSWPGVVAIDERYASAPPVAGRDWPLAPGCATPAPLREAVRPMRIDPADLDEGVRGPIPARTMAYALSVHAAAMALAAEPDWRFLAVAYPALNGGDAGHAFYDMLLDHLLGAAGVGAGADVITVSSGGMLMAAGPRFASDRIAHGVSAVDVGATVLSLFDLEVEGATGRSFAQPGQDTRRTVQAAIAAAPVTGGEPPAEARAALDQLASRTVLRQGLEAVERGDHVAAAACFADALRRSPDLQEPALLLAQSAFIGGDAATCRMVGERLEAAQPGSLWSLLVRGAAAALEGSADADRLLDAAAALAGDEIDPHLRLGAIALYRGRLAQARDHYRRVDRAAHDRPAHRAAALAGMAMTYSAEGALAEAEQLFRASLGQRYFAPDVHRELGRIYYRQGRLPAARSAFRTAMRQAPGLPGIADDLKKGGQG